MRAALLAGALVALAGCVTVDVKTPGTPLDPALLRTRVETRQFTADFTERVALAADLIAARSPQARLDTLRWKIGAASASRRAGYRSEPQLALVDSWALAVQMAQFFESGAGRRLFGDEHPAALEAARTLARDADTLAGRLLRPNALTAYREVVTAYAAADPLSDLAFERAPIAARWREAAGQYGTLMQTSGTAAEVAADAAQRMEQLRVPDEVRWRTELAIAESGLQAADVRDTLRRFEEEFARLGELARTQPALAMARLEAMQAELTRVAAQFDRRWAQTLEAFAVERAAVMRDLEALRAALDASLVRERKAIVADAGQLSKELLPLAMQEVRRAVGEALALLIVLALVLLLLPFAAGYLVGRARRPTAEK
ncbi:MAG TPA: hypothetical protein VFV84_04710 [Burkholderiales bacterium]|nr:hypothetical protein [Burkholderiales bacterium]